MTAGARAITAVSLPSQTVEKFVVLETMQRAWDR
jgi:hypothetical protein